jgi:tetratricopeptide (TPR) repeat protein
VYTRAVGIALVLISLLASAAARAQSKADPYIAAGKAALETRTFDRAVSYFEQALQREPANKEAARLLEAAVRARGQARARADALTAAGRAALAAQAFDKATSYFEKALEEWPESGAAQAGLQKAVESTRKRVELRDILGLTPGLAWPLVAVVVLVIFWRQLKRFLEGFGALAERGAIKALSLPGVLALEFADLREAPAAR